MSIEITYKTKTVDTSKIHSKQKKDMILINYLKSLLVLDLWQRIPESLLAEMFGVVVLCFQYGHSVVAESWTSLSLLVSSIEVQITLWGNLIMAFSKTHLLFQ